MFESLTVRGGSTIVVSVENLKNSDIEDSGTVETKVNLCAAGALDSLDSAIAGLFGDRPSVIVTDETIWAAVSGHFSAFLKARPDTILHILPGVPAPYASDDEVAAVKAALASVPGRLPIAVGSGTVNDLVKRASFELGLRYVCVPTAPSVDGFTSYGAAITVRGFKLTLECPAPLCVVADEEILREAPGEMISAGFADLLAKLPAGADWILADELGIEAIDKPTWDTVQPIAQSLLGQGSAVKSRNPAAVVGLYRGLVASGLAMQRYRDSRPASGAEHLFSHTCEMFHLEKDGRPVSHGFKVALGSLISVALAKELFAPGGSLRLLLERRDFKPEPDLLGRRMHAAELLLKDSQYYDQTKAAIAAKTPDVTGLETRARKARDSWGNLAARYDAQIPGYAAFKTDLLAGGCPTEPEDIGLSRAACVGSLKVASLIRKRYTVLDLVSELGILDEAVEAVFSDQWFSRYAT